MTTVPEMVTTVPELMTTDDRGGELWRIEDGDVHACAWCGKGALYAWCDENAKALPRACSLLCAERRVRRPAP